MSIDVDTAADALERITVDGIEIAWRSWGDGERALLLVHGGGAHMGWWEPMLPHLAPGRRVVAVDLSGHGESDRRPEYPLTGWADELAAVIERVIRHPAVVVAHSMSGRVAPLLAAQRPDLVEALVLVDSALPLSRSFVPPSGRREPTRYASEAEAIARFRLMPEQPAPAAEALEALARRSVIEVDGGWTWRFDPQIFLRVTQASPEQALARVRCPVTIVHGELSVVTESAMALEIAALLGRAAPLVVMPGRHHHLMVEAPSEVAALLDWLPETRVSG